MLKFEIFWIQENKVKVIKGSGLHPPSEGMIFEMLLDEPLQKTICFGIIQKTSFGFPFMMMYTEVGEYLVKITKEDDNAASVGITKPAIQQSASLS